MVLHPEASQDRCQRGMQGLEELRSVLSGMLVRLAEKLDPGEPVRFECGSPSFAACP